MNTPPNLNQNSQPNLSAVAIPRAGRHLIFGATGTGKSELATQLVRQWEATQPNPRILILDSKPHYRAEWELNGIRTRWSRRYKGMDHGTPLPGSVALPLQQHGELALAWQRGHKIAIAQIDDLQYLGALKAVLGEFYKTSRSRYSQLAYADEFADFFGTSATFGRGDAIMQVIRSGRERGVGFLGLSQRPRNIPPAALTEASAFSVFTLESEKDRAHLADNGLGMLQQSDDEHAFWHYNRKTRSGGLYRLNLGKEKQAA